MLAKIGTLALAGAVVLVVGVLLGGWLAGTRSAGRVQPAAGPPSPASSELAPVLAELTRVLADLGAVLEQLRTSTPEPSPEAPARESAGLATPTSDTPELAAALHALAASLRALDTGPGRDVSPSASRALVVPVFVNRERAFAGVGLREAQDSDDEIAWERAMEAFRKKHLFWATQQVLDTYGKPDEIEVGEQYSTWSYRLPVADDEEETYTFYLSDGLVYSVEYSY